MIDPELGNACGVTSMEGSPVALFFMLFCILQFALPIPAALTIFYMSNKVLDKQKHHMTEKTIQMHRQLLKSLLLQVLFNLLITIIKLIYLIFFLILFLIMQMLYYILFFKQKNNLVYYTCSIIIYSLYFISNFVNFKSRSAKYDFF